MHMNLSTESHKIAVLSCFPTELFQLCKADISQILQNCFA
jgi:hypothetical protein